MHRLGTYLFGAGAAFIVSFVALSAFLVVAGGTLLVLELVLVPVGAALAWGTIRGVLGSESATIAVGVVGLVWAVISGAIVSDALFVPALVAGLATAAGATLMLRTARWEGPR